ncbi:DUF4043 family protein [Azoarcus indigens]|uniref:N4-gp56 family major capsid protein n=1 Tax=Azoarcus indigens TaxID=29545 RepID=A0A4R6DVC9_9RHOO|nr:DUF4043 family protein [Azoarcus indigens]NMG64366.1 DUF4043 family protein [Azoarcus indigens]TDN49180.1 N4-gp56 family major capsid protein [Azoarcus indigens]
MAHSALGALQPEQRKLWVKESIRAFREAFFFTKFLGTSENSIVQYVTELKKTEKGDRALIGLVADMRGTGVVGDNELQGREEALESSWVEIHTDQMRNGAKSKGRVDDQRSVFAFRKEARDKLAFWRANITEELMMLTASGIGYQYNTDGSTRLIGAQDDLRTLEFADDVRAPSSRRHFRFDGTDLQDGDTTQISATSVPKYGMIVDLMAEARTRGIKPLRMGGQEYMVYLCHPKTFARLKKDPDFRDAVINAGDRGAKNPIFTGATLTMDGLVIHTNNRVFNTAGAASGSKWGSGGNVNGTRSLLMGCQALGYADIWGSANWYEGKDDHDNKDVISIAAYQGVLKPQFISRYDSDTVQDFGVMAVDLAL